MHTASSQQGPSRQPLLAPGEDELALVADGAQRLSSGLDLVRAVQVVHIVLQGSVVVMRGDGNCLVADIRLRGRSAPQQGSRHISWALATSAGLTLHVPDSDLLQSSIRARQQGALQTGSRAAGSLFGADKMSTWDLCAS